MNWFISLEGVKESVGLDKLSPVTIMLVSFFVLLFFFSEILDRVYKPSNNSNLRNSFFVLYEYNVRRVYVNQERSSHDTLYRGVESILRPGVSRPSIITLVSVGRGAACTALMLAHSTAAVIMQLLNPFGVTGSNRYTIRGRDYTSAEDYWEFNARTVSLLSKYRVAVVTDFECLHPQVATMLTVLVNDATIPQPKSVILVILDTGERFNVSEPGRSREMSETAIRECLGPFLERRELDSLVDTLSWRACIVLNEPSHRPSTCIVCSPPKRPTNVLQQPLLLE